jgi:hypothetical protein
MPYRNAVLVLIVDSDLDIGLVDPHGGHDPDIVSQIKEYGVPVDSHLQDFMAARYHINPSKVTLLKNNNFILLQEPERVRVFMIE